jgi:5-methylcytosine-specific restriction endonuclease McrA
LKYPWVKWFPADWLADGEIAKVSPAARGLWFEILNCMMHSSTDTLEGTPEELSRVLRCSLPELSSALEELKPVRVCDLEVRNGRVKFTSRRLHREAKVRENGRNRTNRFRANGGGDPDRWTAIRVDILRRDDYRCAYCGRKARTVDHIHPKSRGGGEEYWNLVAACKPCNNTKTDRTPEEAGMNFHKSFNKSVLEKRNTSITLSGSASAYASDPPGNGGPGEREIDLPPGFPPTADDAVRLAGHCGADTVFITALWNSAMARNGLDGTGQAIRWPYYVAKHWPKEVANRAQARANGKPDPTKSIEDVVADGELRKVRMNLRKMDREDESRH